MKISYVNHVRDTEESDCPLSIKQLQHSMLMAIKHRNVDLIEPLLSKGVPLTEPLSNGKSALINACEVGSEIIIEKLLIRSMRSFTLYPSVDILRVLEWLFSNRLYRIVDLTFFSIKQSVEGMKKYGRFIEAVEALEKLGDGEQKDKHAKLLATYQEIITSTGFRKDFYYYLYYVWKKIDNKQFGDKTKIYQLLSEAFEREQDRVQNLALLSKRARLTWNLGAITFVSCLLILQIFALIHWPLLSIPLGSGIAIVALVLASSLMREYHYWKRQLAEQVVSQNFLKAAREGEYKKVSQYLESDGYVNVMEGVAESTPLREAERMGHDDIKVLLRKLGAFSAEGCETYSFPQ